jgi:SAM-dependent methyltransferase
MNLSTLLTLAKTPKLYEPGTATMWDDDHISGHLLLMHLDKSTDAASRKQETIQKTVVWIESHLHEKADILDLGCGPGLYCELLAEHGYSVFGVDVSRRSIAHAKEQASRNHLSIEYLCRDYLDLSYENRFDLVMMIYCDFCVLIPQDRDRLLDVVFHALKPGGLFLFDALNENAPGYMEITKKSFEIAESGFWRDEPYLTLSDKVHYKKEHVILQQHIVCTDADPPAIYLFWNHYYHPDTLGSLLCDHGLTVREKRDDLVAEDNTPGMVTFYVAEKV